ncbi:glycosyltransferase [Azospirillum halopraeferens]|uniref:glycosyltransferase n=1 Tax=Azospirillum halopraeferens TaxID=34010 RepID=UPI00042A2E1D|nr:glycosyltransferase [Azospirillum halopraeferens]
MRRRKVLICDYDFHTTLGGGQVLYRRIVERNPEIDFFYPSNGGDLKPEVRRLLPANAHPYAHDRTMDVSFLSAADPGMDWVADAHLGDVARMLAPLQGMVFEAADVPSFRPVAHLLRPVAAAFGVVIDRVVLGMVGWASNSMRTAYRSTPQEWASIEHTIPLVSALESRSIAAADQRYTISGTERADAFGSDLPIALLDMHDTIESFPPVDARPPGEGPPDLWYVGRLDGAKGPDLFLELAARLPRHLFGGCFYAGPDNDWSPTARWSDHLADLAAARGLDAVYAGTPSDEEIRRRVYAGRVVLVVPSRTDAFNYVALEAVMNGCPLLLSSRTGASEFLRLHHPHLQPPLMDPDDPDDAVVKLRTLLETYPAPAVSLRRALRERPLPKPRSMFMDPIYTSEPASSTDGRDADVALALALGREASLRNPGLSAFHSSGPRTRPARVSLIVRAPADPNRLAPLLANLARQTLPAVEVLVVDAGTERYRLLRDITGSLFPGARILCAPDAGGCINHALGLAGGECVGVVAAGDRLAADWLAAAVAALEAAPDAVGVYPDWALIDEVGAPVGRSPDEAFCRARMLTEHRCLPGPGAIARGSAMTLVGGHDPAFRFLADFDLWLRISGEGTVIRVPWIAARRHSEDHGPASPDVLGVLAAEHVDLVERFAQDPREAGRCRNLLPAARAAAGTAAARTRTEWASVPLSLLGGSFGWAERAWIARAMTTAPT